MHKQNHYNSSFADDYQYSTNRANLEQYNNKTYGIGLNWGFPINEYVRVGFGVGFKNNEITSLETYEQIQTFYDLHAEPDKPDSLTYSLIDQADIALQLWNKMGLKEVSILAHDYGTSVAKELLSRKNHNLIPLKIRRVCLCNSSMRLEHLHLRNMGNLLKNKKLGKFIARLTSNSYQKFKKKIKSNSLDPHLNNKYDINNVWDQMNTSQGQKEIHLSDLSMVDTLNTSNSLYECIFSTHNQIISSCIIIKELVFLAGELAVLQEKKETI